MSGNYSSPYDCASTCTGDLIAYSYDGNGAYGWGRLTQVTDSSGSMVINSYDVRGRVLQDTKTVDPSGAPNPTSAQMTYDYDEADHLKHLTYPDGEVVEYAYNAAGQVKSFKSLTHQVYHLANLTYDVFDRPLAISHGNSTTDTRTYYPKA